jgi:hypothetical protein
LRTLGPMHAPHACNWPNLDVPSHLRVWLRRPQVMDYSLLLGVHFCARGRDQGAVATVNAATATAAASISANPAAAAAAAGDAPAASAAAIASGHAAEAQLGARWPATMLLQAPPPIPAMPSMPLPTPSALQGGSPARRGPPPGRGSSGSGAGAGGPPTSAGNVGSRRCPAAGTAAAAAVPAAAGPAAGEVAANGVFRAGGCAAPASSAMAAASRGRHAGAAEDTDAVRAADVVAELADGTAGDAGVPMAPPAQLDGAPSAASLSMVSPFARAKPGADLVATSAKLRAVRGMALSWDGVVVALVTCGCW